MFDSDSQTRVGAGEQLTRSACRDTSCTTVTALSRHKLDRPLPKAEHTSETGEEEELDEPLEERKSRG